MANNQPQGARGWAKLKKTGGQTTSPALNSTIYFPTLLADPHNPDNYQYPAVMNALGAPSVLVQGMKTPAFTLLTCLKRSWFTADAFKSLIGGAEAYLDTYFNNDEYLCGINNGSSTRYYSGAHCQLVRLSGQGVGGPISCYTEWLAVAGDSENSPGSVTTPTVDAGSLMDLTQYDWGSSPTIDPVYTWSFTILRPVAYQPVCNGTLYSDSPQCGNVGHIFTYTSSPTGTTVPTTSATLRIKIADTPTYVTIAMNLNRDQYAEQVAASRGVCMRVFTGFNSSGGYPFTIT